MPKRCALPVVVLIFFSVILLFISCGTTTVIGSGNIITQARSVSGFTRISFSGAGELNIQQGATESLDITTDDNLMEYIETTVENGVLKIEFREGVDLDPSGSITFDLVVNVLSGISFSGAGSIQVDTLIVSSGTFDFSVSGVADCVISGQSNHQNILISGTCTYEASDFESKTAAVNVSGVGDITVWVSDNLDVDISGVGDVDYWGSPVTNINISGIGDVQKLGDK